jgi:outer membrane protein assembly factor BamD (BamD/ComL family)
MRRRMYRWWQTISPVAALVCVLMVGCGRWPDAEVSSTQHDKLLFEHAMSALEQGRYSVANLTLQTLINTYPDSEYASRAQEVLDDPRIAPCGESFTSSPQCIDRRVDNYTQSPAVSQ